MKKYEIFHFESCDKIGTYHCIIDFSGCNKCTLSLQFNSLKIYLNGDMHWFFMGYEEEKNKTKKCQNCKDIFMTVEDKEIIETTVRLAGFQKIENILRNLGFNPSK